LGKTPEGSLPLLGRANSRPLFTIDLEQVLPSARDEYLLGGAVLRQPSADARFTVIDGQQSLATTPIPIGMTRDLLSERGDVETAAENERSYVASTVLGAALFASRLL
jgi:hypothetical protein